MPTPPSSWVPGPLSPQQLNTDLVSFDGTGFTPNGVVFHSHRTTLYETVTASRALPASSSGTWPVIAGTGTTAFSVLDTSALYSTGGDNPGVFAAFEYTPSVNGSGGLANVIGGYFLSSLYATSAAASGTPAACGAGVSSFAGTSAPVLYSQGAIQAQSTGKTGCAPWLDLIDVVSGTELVSATYETSGTWVAPSGVSSVQVQCWAGGGGGAGGTGGGFPGAGGGGGEYAANFSYPVTAGNTYIFVIGAAGILGTLGANGGNGGNTVFDTGGSGVTANGGKGGFSGSTGGSGGSGSTAPVHFSGGEGDGTGGGGGGSGGTGSPGNDGGSDTGAPAVPGGGPGGDGNVSGNGSAPASGPGGGGGGGSASGIGGPGWQGQLTLSWLEPGSTTFTWEPTAFVLDASAGSLTPPSNSTDTAGITSRALFTWTGVTSGGTTVSAVPTPQQTWPSITSALLNGPTGPKQALTFLNNPPLLRVSQALTTSIPSGSNTTLSFGTAAAVMPDTYNGWDGTSTYTAALTGLYLAAPTVPYSANAAGQRYCGVTVNGGTVYRGPSYYPVQGASNVTSVTQLRLLDLNAGDTVSAFAFQDSGGSLALTSSYGTRLVMAMLCPLSTGSGALVTAPPDTSFRWSAGLSSSQLPALLNLHLGNDLSFLVNRPYFTGYQGTAQSGFANNTWNAVTIDTPGGLLHSSNGDNYAGWNPGANAYAAQQAGWYLVISEVFATAPGLTTGYLTAGISITSSGGIAPSIGPDSYQSVFYPLTTGTAPGASAIGLYYLMAGEQVSPAIRADSWTAGTWGTTSSSTIRSQFSVVWLCELEGREGALVTDSERAALNELNYRKSMARIGVLVGVCFIFLVILTASFIVTDIDQNQFNQLQQSQQKQGQVVEDKLCTTLESLRNLKPPLGNPSSNPSRAYLQQQHDKLAELSVDIGCKG